MKIQSLLIAVWAASFMGIAVSVPAQAPWEDPYDWYQQEHERDQQFWSDVVEQPQDTEPSYHDQFMQEMQRQQERAEERYHQDKWQADWWNARNACEAIGGNDAARADCFRSLGGW